MWWLVLTMGGIALVGAIVAVVYAIMLYHKASDLFFEMRRVGTQLATVADLAGQIRVPDRRLGRDDVD